MMDPSLTKISVGSNESYGIKNPTAYFPDRIIERYIKQLGVGASAVQEYKKERDKGFTEEAAAQNLFVRAVRAVEYEENKQRFLNIVIFYNLCIQAMASSNDSSSNFIGLLFVGTLMKTGIALIFFYIFAWVTDKMNVNLQRYSI